MKPVYFLAVCAALFATPLYAKEAPKPDPKIGGRVETVSEVLPGTTAPRFVHQWPGVYFETRLEGKAATLHFDDAYNRYKLFVDDKPPVVIDRPGKKPYELKGLSSGTHLIRLEKISESQSNSAGFYGFTSKGKLNPTPAHTRQIEFIGDSFTVGYGNTSPKRDCTTDEVWATTDTSQVFGPLIAKHYKADYQINAFSGRGVVRNYDGFVGDTLPTLYDYTLFDGKTAYKDPNWQPQIIVIGLGTNDFSTPLKPDQKWATRQQLRADYRESYVAFVLSLRAKHPNAHFILMASENIEREIANQVEAVKAILASEGETRVDTLIFTGLDYAGCHAHPSVADSQIIKSLLINLIDARPDLWQGK